MSELTAPIVTGFVVGIAFIIIFAIFSNPTPILTTVGDWIVGESLTQRYAFGNAIHLPETSGAGGIGTGSSGSTLYVAWHAPSGIFFARTPDDGSKFGSNISLTNSTITSDASIVAEDNNLYFVWSARGRSEKTSDIRTDTFFRASHDEGATLDHVINLSNNVEITQTPQIAVSENNVYVVWQDYTPGQGQILLRISNDNGITFGDTINLSNDTGSSHAPQIVASGSNVYVVWHSFEPRGIMFKWSHDNGSTFSRAINLRTIETGSACCPKLAATENDVYVIWIDSLSTQLLSGHYDLHFRTSHNGGITFGQTTSLTNIARDYQIAVSGNNVYVVWTNVLPVNNTMENAEAFFIRSTDKGVTFENPFNLSNNEGPSSNQQIAVSNNEVYVTWVDHTLDYNEILFRGSNDYGASFGRVVNLSNGTGISVDPHIVADETLYVVWKEFGDESHEDGIYIIRRTD